MRMLVATGVMVTAEASQRGDMSDEEVVTYPIDDFAGCGRRSPASSSGPPVPPSCGPFAPNFDHADMPLPAR